MRSVMGSNTKAGSSAPTAFNMRKLMETTRPMDRSDSVGISLWT